MKKVNFRKTAVGVSIEIGRICIRLAHPCYWGLLKAVKVSKSKASGRP
ncbi:MAG: hypothetical protein HYU75_24465 [Betaproteobacteria bacterium]|nr:hypothetical protein [Betaproteobacteria bacterium]